MKLLKMAKEKSKIILWGVSFALLEFAEKYPMKLENAIIIETGGMKGEGKKSLEASYTIN